jgi:rfaE bifunctional protein nucleotidyltransferase chain/domain
MAGPVVRLSTLLAELGPRRARGERVVVTNGVFDLLHVGHLRYLREARGLGDVLVVGVNTDASVRALKPGRPLVSEGERAELVGALEPVDFVVLFAEPTAEQLIAAIRPDVYVKGGDYTPGTLPEAAAVRAAGARLVLIPPVPGASSTALLERVRGQQGASAAPHPGPDR